MLLLTVFIAAAVWPATAAAKGGGVGMLVPGERFGWRSDVPLGSVEEAQAAAGIPHFIYLERRGSSRAFERVWVGRLKLAHLSPEHRHLRYRFSFVVPDLPRGWYRLSVCDAGCDSPLVPNWGFDPVHIVENALERDLRELMRTQRYELSELVSGVRDDLESYVQLHDIRQRYQATRSIDLGRRIERLEDRMARPSTAQSGARGSALSLWLVGLGFGAGLCASRCLNFMRDRRAASTAARHGRQATTGRLGL